METLQFQAETTRLLDLVIHSLYTRREIFLRELISNASDALDRFHFETLLDAKLADAAEPLEISLEVDPTARTLTVRDNGIGMSRAEVIANIGTIARSGTQETLARVAAQQPPEPLDLIGRFGVGFYSSFMVADRVVLMTRRFDESTGTRWESHGTVDYTIDDAAEVPRGTSVTLFLKPADTDNGLDDYTNRWVLSGIVKRYADFLTHPIVYVGPANDPELDAAAAAAPTRVILNSMKPIWLRPESQVTAEEYTQFYTHISHDWDEPMFRMAFRAEGRWEYAALLFAPAKAATNLYYQAAPFGLQLYAHRVMISEDSAELLPRYLRFLKGVVDAGDLELNVSRQNLQDAQHLTRIRKWITRKVLDHLAQFRADDPVRYRTFWAAFGRVLKEGASEDYDNRDRLLPLYLFQSSHHPEELTTLAEYVGRMKDGQTEIYYLTGESREVIERSPHLEEVRNRGFEVLYLTESVDELLVQALPDFDGRRLRSVAKGRIDFGDTAEREHREAAVAEAAKTLQPLMDFLARHLEAHVKSVRVSTRLTTSPACLTGDEYDYSPQLERLLLKGKGGGARQRRIFELNPQHPLVTRLADRARADADDPLVASGADVLFGYALLAEGSELLDASRFNDRLLTVLGHALGTGAPSPADHAATIA